ncbi:hypothetical protein FPV67DRAFT_1197069 [Lyophyllum atratum]|nr:hypothetical protein FPV67DRAFT_1197069 [Lyophyllum atratum]
MMTLHLANASGSGPGGSPSNDTISTEEKRESGSNSELSRTAGRSLISEIAPEILQEIFMHCLEYDSAPNCRVAPLLLCHVCSQWREIASATPRLWDTLDIYEDTEGILSEDHSAKTAQTITEARTLWFKAIQQHAISFSLTIRTEAVSHTATSLVLPLHPQTRLLDLSLFDDFQLINYAHLHEGHMPFLESVRISADDYFYTASMAHWARPRYPSFESAPQLRRLALDMPNMRLNTATLSFPWAQLTHLIISRSLSIDAWHEIGRQCPQLQELAAELSPIPLHGMWDTMPRPASFPHLRDLTLLLVETTPLEGILGGLSFPALKTLYLGCDDEYTQFQDAVDPILLLCSHTQLTELTLQNAELDADELVQILRTTTQLTSLDIDSDINLDELLEELYHDPHKADHALVVPRLEYLSLSVKANRILEWADTSDQLVKTVRSRRRSVRVADESAASTTTIQRVSSLRCLTLIIDSEIVEDEVEASEPFEPLKAQGFQISILISDSMVWEESISHQLWRRWEMWRSKP